MLNNVIIMGRLCKDVEMRRTQNGTPVASFTLAVDRDFNREETDFVPVVAWKNTAEFVEKYFAKGMMAIVAGRLQFREWTNKDGDRRKAAEVVADRVYFGEAKTSGGGRMKASAPTGEGFDFADLDDDQIPF